MVYSEDAALYVLQKSTHCPSPKALLFQPMSEGHGIQTSDYKVVRRIKKWTGKNTDKKCISALEEISTSDTW
jgi:hypothetical protein